MSHTHPTNKEQNTQPPKTSASSTGEMQLLIQGSLVLHRSRTLSLRDVPKQGHRFSTIRKT